MNVLGRHDLFELTALSLKRSIHRDLVVHDRHVCFAHLSQTLTNRRIDVALERSGSSDATQKMKRLSRSLHFHRRERNVPSHDDVAGIAFN